MEKTNYRFTMYYFPELKETGLVLPAENETVGDGKYNAGCEFPKGWRFSPSGPNYKPIKLPEE